MQADNISHILFTGPESSPENFDDTSWFFGFFKRKNKETIKMINDLKKINQYRKNMSTNEMKIALRAAELSAVTKIPNYKLNNKNHNDEDSSQDDDVKITAVDESIDGIRRRKKEKLNNEKPTERKTSKDQSIDENVNSKWYSFIISIVNWISGSFSSSPEQVNVDQQISTVEIADNLMGVNPNYVQPETIDTGAELDEVVVLDTTDEKELELNKQINDKSFIDNVSKQSKEIDLSSCANSNYSASTFLSTKTDKNQDDDDVIFDARYLEIINSQKHIDDEVPNKIETLKKEQVENDDGDESNWYNELFSKTRGSFFELFATDFSVNPNYVKSKDDQKSRETPPRSNAMIFNKHVINTQVLTNDEKLKIAEHNNRGFIKMIIKILTRIPELIGKLFTTKNSTKEIKKDHEEEEEEENPQKLRNFFEQQEMPVALAGENYYAGPIEGAIERCYQLPVFTSINYRPWEKELLAAVLKSCERKVLLDNAERREALFGDNIEERKKPLVTMEQAKRVLEKIERKKLEEFKWRMEARQYWAKNQLNNNKIIDDDHDEYVDDNCGIKKSNNDDEILLGKGDLTDKRNVESSDEFDDDNFLELDDDDSYSDLDDDDDDNYLEQDVDDNFY